MVLEVGDAYVINTYYPGYDDSKVSSCPRILATLSTPSRLMVLYKVTKNSLMFGSLMIFWRPLITLGLLRRSLTLPQSITEGQWFRRPCSTCVLSARCIWHRFMKVARGAVKPRGFLRRGSGAAVSRRSANSWSKSGEGFSGRGSSQKGHKSFGSKWAIRGSVSNQPAIAGIALRIVSSSMPISSSSSALLIKRSTSSGLNRLRGD